ncbi:MAG TPA: DNA internalization-related competence protein ComEC/Rec2 [Candidatus Limnocylindrales bacterium]|nr:DNA internalization-related competence protein ComEC/Rec2 [Candidatus Limnocylindrales bacterium]
MQQKMPGFVNRPLVMITAAYIAGIVVGRFWLTDTLGAYLLAGLLLLPFLLAVFWKMLSFYRALLFLLAMIAGGIAFVFSVVPDPGGLLSFAGTPVNVTGTVIDEPHFYEDHTAYRLRVETVETREGSFPIEGTLLVRIYGTDAETYWFAEKLHLRGTIVEPRGQRNPDGFDYRFHLRGQGIDALFYPTPSRISALGLGNVHWLTASAVNLRNHMVEAILAALPSPSAELLTAIIFGEQHRLPEAVEVNFRRAGVGHLMAVSGLHVGLVAALVLGLWRRLKLRGRVPLILAIVLVFGYAYLTGFGPSAVRASVMTAIALVALLLDRERDLPVAIAAAALITLIFNPLLLFTVGFQLSYAATLALIYAFRPLEQIIKRLNCPDFLRSVLVTTMVAQLGVLPLSVYYFHHLPTGALFFNLLLVPLTALVLGFGLSGAIISLIFPLPGAVVLWGVRPLLEFMLNITSLAQRPGFYIAMSPPGLLFVVIYYSLFAFGLVLYDRWHRRLAEGESLTPFASGKSIVLGVLEKQNIRPFTVIGVVLGLAVLLLWTGIFLPDKPTVKVTFLDVGQGAAAIIETCCGSVIMADAGGQLPFRGEPGEIGERVLLPFLRSQGMRHLDLVVITHPHEDHFGGFVPLIEAITIDSILISPFPGDSLIYEELLHRAGEKGITIKEVWAGQVWFCCSGLALEILYPSERLLRGTGSDINNNSIVFRLSYGDVRMLFTGDIENPAFLDLQRQNVDLRADLLQIPHHGGFMEGMPYFLEEVQPVLAVIQVGPNTFGHPHPFIIDSLEEADVDFYRTDTNGAIIVETDGSEIWVKITARPISLYR